MSGKWFVRTSPNGKSQGPVSQDRLRTLYQEGKLKDQHELSEEETRWIRVEECPWIYIESPSIEAHKPETAFPPNPRVKEIPRPEAPDSHSMAIDVNRIEVTSASDTNQEFVNLDDAELVEERADEIPQRLTFDTSRRRKQRRRRGPIVIPLIVAVIGAVIGVAVLFHGGILFTTEIVNGEITSGRLEVFGVVLQEFDESESFDSFESRRKGVANLVTVMIPLIAGVTMFLGTRVLLNLLRSARYKQV